MDNITKPEEYNVDKIFAELVEKFLEYEGTEIYTSVDTESYATMYTFQNVEKYAINSGEQDLYDRYGDKYDVLTGIDIDRIVVDTSKTGTLIAIAWLRKVLKNLK